MKTHVVEIKNRGISAKDRELVSGTLGEDVVRLSLDDDWDGLDLTVAFTGCGTTVAPVANPDGTYTIPWEVMARPGAVGMYVEGRDAEGKLVLRHRSRDDLFATSPGSGIIAAASPTPVARGERGAKGDKGDKMTFADLTDDDKAELMRPATDAAAKADEAAKSATDAAAAAQKAAIAAGAVADQKASFRFGTRSDGKTGPIMTIIEGD